MAECTVRSAMRGDAALVVSALILGCCRAMPSSTDGGDGGGSPRRCWAPLGTVFSSHRGAVLAREYEAPSSQCFPSEAEYRLVNYRDGGLVGLATERDAGLVVQERVNGAFALQLLASNGWRTIGRLYFGQLIPGRVLPRSCATAAPVAGGFSCDGRIEWDDAGVGPSAEDWLQEANSLYALLDGGIRRYADLSQAPLQIIPQSEGVLRWAADETGFSTLTGAGVLRVFEIDGGASFEVSLDAGAVAILRRAGVTYYSRETLDLAGEVCGVRSAREVLCSPGYITSSLGDDAWGPSSIFVDAWAAVHYRYDGGWHPGGAGFVAPEGWFPSGSSPRAAPSGVVLHSPDGRRVLAWLGYRGVDDELMLVEAPERVHASGMGRSVLWTSWDGGTFVGSPR